jgi:hypothetical protein
MLHNVASCLKILNLLVVSAHQEKMKKQRAHSDKERSSHGLHSPHTTLHMHHTPHPHPQTTTKKTGTLHYACKKKSRSLGIIIPEVVGSIDHFRKPQPLFCQKVRHIMAYHQIYILEDVIREFAIQPLTDCLVSILCDNCGTGQGFILL